MIQEGKQTYCISVNLKSKKTKYFGSKVILLFTRTISGSYTISCEEYKLFSLMPKL